MTCLTWRKSSFSGEAANCIYIAVAPDGTVRLRESDAPEASLTVTRNRLAAFVAAIKGGGVARVVTK
ncbi:DUF397 domain-containing protein [Streptomyces chrestomyceticus]|uniref:DUF397 domain-containing protein n=1 Tax=Streptomyces chrestomyceticus TaxID=68185 RepID=UPI0019D10AAC|nr:DUF397 domain-containing protein [Streptomyces chrestomyceticus]